MTLSRGSRAFGAGLSLLALLLALLAAPPHAGGAGLEAEIEAGTAAYAAGSLAGAHAGFERAVRLDARSFTALRWLARTESDLGEDAKGEEQRTLFANAVVHARAAVAAAPDSARGHLELAVALGRPALREGPRPRPALSREIKAQAHRAPPPGPRLGRAPHPRAPWDPQSAGLCLLARPPARA